MAELASTIQAAHIKRDPSPLHDANPSTAASEREPVSLLRSAGGSDEDDDDDIPVSVLKPTPRHARGAGSGKHAGARGDLPPHFPPMPDLRFEQSYLHSISAAESWWRIAWITVRDQVRDREGYTHLYTAPPFPSPLISPFTFKTGDR